MKAKKVDIIIPIYHALHNLQKCIDNINNSECDSPYRLILIVSGDTKEEINKYLDDQNADNTIVLYSSCNQGFAVYASQEMNMSENDIILLDSDTIVTPGWIDKLHDCAYHDSTIATVSPLSNTVLSLVDHDFCVNGSVWDSQFIQKYGKEIERSSLHSYPEISVASISCMYIKRDTIREIGSFDFQEFEGDYDIVVDFCYRAVELGYKNVVCDNTYIYHKKIKKLSISNMTMIKKRYGNLIDTISEENIVQCFDAEVYQNIKLYDDLQLFNGKKNILYYSMADFREDASYNMGGTQLHIKDLVSYFRKHYNVFVAARDEEYLNVTEYTDSKELFMRFYIGSRPIYNRFRDTKHAEIYKNILIAFKIDLVHVQHTMWMPLDIYYEASQLNIPIILTVHDYYYLCPALKAVGPDNSLCLESKDTSKCEECLWSLKKIYPKLGYIEKWRIEHRKILNLCKDIIVPSQSVYNNFVNHFSEVAHKIEIIPHGINIKLDGASPEKKDDGKLHIAFIGEISESKGGNLIYNMITQFPRQQYEWYLFGGIASVNILHLEQENLHKTGWYERDELYKLLKQNNIDIICILSIVPETFCYTLSEAIACSIPVAVTDVGALGDRMRELECGWIVPRDADIEYMKRFFDDLQKNRGIDIKEKTDRAKKTSCDTVLDMCGKQGAIYTKILLDKHLCYEKDIYDKRMILNAYIFGSKTSKKCEIETPDETIKLLNELNEIKGSLSFKLVERMRMSKFPMKQSLKRFLERFTR